MMKSALYTADDDDEDDDDEINIYAYTTSSRQVLRRGDCLGMTMRLSTTGLSRTHLSEYETSP